MVETVLAWSGGKDAAYALVVLREANVGVAELLTTINTEYDRSTMHGVRRELYERQAAALGLPINFVSLPPEPSNDEYQRIMARELARYREQCVGRAVFGDIFLEDVREYRESQLDGTGVEGCWPIWGRDTADLVADVLARGFRAVVVAVDADVLGASAVGRELDERFLAELPTGVDPCGENGEFHTFVWDGPGFDEPVPVEVGETVTRPVGDGEFHYADLRLSDGA